MTATILSSNLGFCRMGDNRQLKKLVEAFWAAKATETQLSEGAAEIRKAHLIVQKDAGINVIPSNDASLYDHVLDHLVVFGAVPSRYSHIASKTDRYFAMGRGLQRPAENIDVPAMEMKKW